MPVRFAEPKDLPASRVRTLLESWELVVDHVDYLPVGHGSYHWLASIGERPAWFVTADRLTAGRFSELDASARVARDLFDAGLAFLVAPVPDSGGELVHVIDQAWAVQVLPCVIGTSSAHDLWDDGTWADPVEQARVASIVGRLHAYPAPDYLPRWDPTPPHWAQLNLALKTALRPSSAGSSFTERTHTLLKGNHHRVLALIQRYELLVAKIRADGDPWVLTHGEPDSDNVIRTEDGRMYLIDWTTAAVAPRERDLFDVLQGPGHVLDVYQQEAGPHPPRANALEMIGLHWRLSHLGHDLALLLNARSAGDDLEQAWTRLLERLDRPPGRYRLH